MTKTVKNTLFTIALVFVLVLSIFSTASAAIRPLDEIQSYVLTVNMRNDGTMDIYYHIEWKVLNSSSEGPLEWVKIGVPNKHIDEITAHTSNISKIRYYTESGNHFARIDFDRKYHEGEIVTFDFSIHQSRMYVIDNEEHLLRYSFTPGWFDEIEVKNITIRWNDFNVIKSNAKSSEDGYLVWNASLNFGEKLNASVMYNLDAFNVSEDEQYTEDKDYTAVIVIIVIVVLGVIFLIWIASNSDDDYSSHSGYGGGSRTTYVHHHSSCVSRCACVSSCACACACAGGGRAGCSKKDFYGTKVQVKDLIEILEED